MWQNKVEPWQYRFNLYPKMKELLTNGITLGPCDISSKCNISKGIEGRALFLVSISTLNHGIIEGF